MCRQARAGRASTRDPAGCSWNVPGPARGRPWIAFGAAPPSDVSVIIPDTRETDGRQWRGSSHKTGVLHFQAFTVLYLLITHEAFISWRGVNSPRPVPTVKSIYERPARPANPPPRRPGKLAILAVKKLEVLCSQALTPASLLITHKAFQSTHKQPLHQPEKIAS